jgi:hypothetical protein
MAQPTGSDVHIDVALSNISIGYQNSGYIADRLFPKVSSGKQSNKYYIWTKDFWFRNYVQQRAAGTVYPEGALELSNTNFFCDIFHLGYPINDEDTQNEDAAVQLDQTGSEWLADQFLLNRESKMVADFFKTGVWGTDLTLSGTDQWSDFSNSDPIDDIRLGIQTVHKATGSEPNQLTIGREVRDILAQHPLLLDMYKHTGVPILTDVQIAAALKIPTLIVGNAIENTAQEGATFSGGYMWGKNAMLLYTPTAPGLRVPAAGYTFIWNIDGGEYEIQIRRTRQDWRDRELLQAKHAFDQKAVGTDLGYFISAAVA